MGRRKVKELNRNQLISIIRGDVGKSVVVSSTLRRAVSTAVMCLITRLSRGNDKVKVMTMLQDCGRSMDTVHHSGQSVATTAAIRGVSKRFRRRCRLGL